MEIETKMPEKTEPKSPDLDFAKVVAQSKDAISQGQTEGIKTKRGRYKTKNNPTGAPKVETVTETAQVSEISTPPPTLAPILKPAIKSISKFPAVKFQIPELAFTDEEALDTAAALDQVVNAFVPDIGKMDPKTAAVIGAFSTISGIGYSKFMIYRSEMAKREKQAPIAPPTAQGETKPAAPAEGPAFPTENIGGAPMAFGFKHE